jgi:hypothetical protein
LTLEVAVLPVRLHKNNIGGPYGMGCGFSAVGVWIVVRVVLVVRLVAFRFRGGGC